MNRRLAFEFYEKLKFVRGNSISIKKEKLRDKIHGDRKALVVAGRAMSLAIMKSIIPRDGTVGLILLAKL